MRMNPVITDRNGDAGVNSWFAIYTHGYRTPDVKVWVYLHINIYLHTYIYSLYKA